MSVAVHAAACVLYVTGNTAGVETTREALKQSKRERYDLECVGSLSDGLERLKTARVSAVLLDLHVPDGPGIDGLERLLHAAPTVPILVIGADEDEESALRAIRAGAYDYLLMSHVDSYWLPRAIAHAIEWKRADRGLAVERESTEVTLNSIGGALLSVDATGRITYLNRMAESMTGWLRDDAIGQPVANVVRIVTGVARQPVLLPTEWPMPGNYASNLVSDCVLIRRDGSESAIEHLATPFVDSHGLMTGASIVFRDVTAARALSLRMAHLASHDPLTNLPNRLLLIDRLNRALALAHRHERQLAVLFLDIDRFKYINDSVGHVLGDELLKAVGREVTMCVRSSDTVSRHGGDEFVVVLSELEHAEDAAAGAQKIIAALNRPQKVAGHEIHITVSIGISVSPGDGRDAETLLKNADMALYHAKDQGRGRYQFFEPALNLRAVARQSLEAGLHGALDKHEFELFYQPKVNLRTADVVGAEALIRWRKPDGALVDAGEFVPAAEDCGLIIPIGRWAVHEACRQARAWQDGGLRPVSVAVNVSGVEFHCKDFLRNIIDTLRTTRLDPHFLEIELTESVLMIRGEATNSALLALKQLGVQLSLDDFGTGWSSLNYLRQFPIDALKIDKSFVHEITADAQTAPLVSAVIRMGKSLNHRVIAEGVETREQFAFLQQEHCDEAQGFYISHRLPAAQFAQLLEPHARPLSEGPNPSRSAFPLWRRADGDH